MQNYLRLTIFFLGLLAFGGLDFYKISYIQANENQGFKSNESSVPRPSTPGLRDRRPGPLPDARNRRPDPPPSEVRDRRPGPPPPLGPRRRPQGRPVLQKQLPVVQGQKLNFSRLGVKNGLSHNRISSIVQDRHGFIWIGTEDGLNRYDGYEFKVYRHNPEEPASLSNNVVYSLLEDKEGSLWIGTQGGVNRFNPDTETFTHMRHDQNDPNSLAGNSVFSISQDSQGFLWFSGPPNEGLSKFDPKTKTFKRYRPNLGTLEWGAIWEMSEDQSGNLWFAADFSLTRFNPETETFHSYFPSPRERRLHAILPDASGDYWLAGSTGLYKFNRAQEQFTSYRLGKRIEAHSLFQDSTGKLWLGTTRNGLFRFDPQTEEFAHQYSFNRSDPHSLTSNYITSLYRDNAGLLWIGTANGLNIFDPKQTQFKIYQHDSNNPQSISSGRLILISGDLQGYLWVVAGETLHRLNSKTGQVLDRVPIPGGRRPSTDSVYSDRKRNVWLGKGRILYRFDPTTKIFQEYSPLQQRQRPGPPVSIHGFLEDQSGNLWIAVRHWGVVHFDRKQETFHSYEPEFQPSLTKNTQTVGGEWTTSIIEDHAGNLWMGDKTGVLSHLEMSTKTFTHHLPDPNNPKSFPGGWIEAIHEDRSKRLWIASRGGLIRFEPATHEFTMLTENDGLPSSYVSGIQEDSQGNLWLSTNKGISRFDPQTGTFENYDMHDGLHSNNFSGDSWQAPDGQLFFVGRSGFSAFYPERVQSNPFKPPVVLTKMENGAFAPFVSSIIVLKLK